MILNIDITQLGAIFLIGFLVYTNKQYAIAPLISSYYRFLNEYNLWENFILFYNELVDPDVLKDFEYVAENMETTPTQPKTEQKYEDKYLKQIRNMNKEWEFPEDRLEDITKIYYNKAIQNLKRCIANNNAEILELRMEAENDTNIDVPQITDSNKINESDEELEHVVKLSLEERNSIRKEKIDKLESDNETNRNLLDTESGQITLKNDANTLAIQFLINENLNKIKDGYVMEKTPLGNVILNYNQKNDAFHYYSDNTIPYRYLEVVARKFVKMFNCRPLFVDMEEELKLCEEKWELIQEEERKKKELEEQNKLDAPKKKDVFAKFKSYNKDTGISSKFIPPKAGVSQQTKEQEKILLKEHANRYTYEGKIVNFKILKPIERKVVDKKYAMTFADFKRINQQKK